MAATATSSRRASTADQIKAGLKWLAFEKLTPGQGQFNYARARSRINLPVGLPQPLIWKPGSAAAEDRTLTSRRPTAT